MKLRLIPAGTFQMGSREHEEGREGDETQHQVTLTKAFYLGVHEVTQGEYERVIGANPSWFSKAGGGSHDVKGEVADRFPVETVSWFDAVEFCNKLSQKDNLPEYYRIDGTSVTVIGGSGYRLPTEAEWEYACRAGTISPFSFGDTLNGNEANVNGNDPYGTTTKGTNLQRTTAVGAYSGNVFGLHDMHGNMYEWCGDWYGTYFPGKEADPIGPTLGEHRVLRGGSWSGLATGARSAFRGYCTPVLRSRFNGFRVSRTP